MNIEFKFSINDRITGFDCREGTIEALCYGKDGVFYRVRLRNSARRADTHKNYFESELLAGWENISRRKNDLAG